MPFELAGVRVERDDRIGIEVVAGTLCGIPIRSGVADSPVRQVQVWVIGACDPDRRASVLPVVALPGFVAGLTGPGDCVETPYLTTSPRVECGDEASNAELATR